MNNSTEKHIKDAARGDNKNINSRKFRRSRGFLNDVKSEFGTSTLVIIGFAMFINTLFDMFWGDKQQRDFDNNNRRR